MIGWRITLWAAIVLVALGFLYLVRGILMPFAVAFIISAVLDPAIRRLRLRGFSRFWAVSLVFTVFFVLATGALIAVTPSIVNQVQKLTGEVQRLTANLAESDENSNYFVRWKPVVQATESGQVDEVDKLLRQNQGWLGRLGLPTTKRAIMEQYIEPKRDEIAGAVKIGFQAFFGVISTLASQILFAVLVPILVFMMLMDMENFKRRSSKWIPPAIRESTLAILSDIGQVFMRYLRGVTTVVILYMVSSAIILSILQVPYSILLGIMFGALYMIPYIGNAISLLLIFVLTGIAGVDYALFVQYNSPWTYATVATAIYFVFGSIFDHLVYPNLVGNSVGLNGVVSLFVILSGGALFGLVGMLLAFPLAGSIKVILDRLMKISLSSPDGINLPAVPLRHRSSTL